MNRIRQHPALTMLLVLVLVIGGLVAFRLTSSGAKTDSRTSRLITVGTAMPIRQDLDIRLSYTADIQPFQQVNIFSRVDG